jgi:LacI family transcriptional regulator
MVDIALQAGVSQATVSLVLNDVTNARVSDDTRSRVKSIAAGLGYASRGTLARRTGVRVIGLLIDELSTTPFASPLLEGACEAATLRGCLVSVFCTGGDPNAEQAAFDVLASLGAIGVLYATLLTRSVTPPDGLSGFQTILLNCHDQERRYPSVVPADVTGSFDAVTALIGAGHRRIAHLAGELWGEAALDRAKGYRQALASADIVYDPALLGGPAWTVGSGREETLRLLALPDPPTAFACFNDRVAIGCYEAIRSKGLAIPDDISVIGFDNEDLVAHLSPPLTTMILPHDEMARWAVGMLTDESAGSARTARLVPKQIKIDCPYVERASVAAPKAI